MDALIESHLTPTMLATPEGDLVYANRAARELLGLPRPVCESHPVRVSDYLEAEGRDAAEALRDSAGSSDWVPLRLILRDGPRWGAGHHFRSRGLVRGGGAGPLAFLVSSGEREAQFAEHTRLIDTLNRELAELTHVKAELDAALRNEKALHRELIHRVKNNLSLLAALTRSRLSDVDAPESREVLRDIQFRIRAIALVHELLDSKNEIELIDADEFLGELCALMQTSICPPGVTITHDVVPLKLHIEVATPLCLLINELVTNSVKHAFRDGQKGVIALEFKKNGVDQLQLTLSDDGSGLREDGPPPRGGSGSRIVAGLAQQMGGELRRSDAAGTSWSFIFTPVRHEGTPAL